MGNMYEDQLMHYGIMGMHWGIRRYQPYPAAYDGDGKYIGDKELKKKIKAERKAEKARKKLEKKERNKAFRDIYDAKERATDLTSAALTSKIRQYRYANDANKRTGVDSDFTKKSTQDAEIEAEAAVKTAQDIDKLYKEAETATIKMIDDFKKKYGDKYVKDLKFKDVSSIDKFASTLTDRKKMVFDSPGRETFNYADIISKGERIFKEVQAANVAKIKDAIKKDPDYWKKKAND